MVRTALVAAGMLLLVLAPPASAAVEGPCPGDPIEPDRVITGDFGTELQKSHVFVPFGVPTGTTAVRVKYCWDEPELNPELGHTIDLGLYEPRADGEGPWGPEEFRGWGGSSHPDVTVSPAGFSSLEEYLAAPKGHVPGRTTRGFRPGPIPPGRWAAELGVAAVVSQLEGDADGRVGWRVEIELSQAPAGDTYEPARYSRRPVSHDAGWYAGDLHVHAEHSALGDATMNEVFDFAFAPRPDGAGLDFLTLSDYVSGGAWGEIGRHQPRYPDKLIIRSAEIITYRGHLNSHANSVYMDYRTGPLYARSDDGTLTQVRGPTAPRATFDRIHAAGGFAQINHPTIFPSDVPGFANLCRGCPWDYSDRETDHRKVDTWEVHTGPAGVNQADRLGPNPFTLTAIERWDELRRMGHRITAVAVSDSHHAGETPGGITQAPIGQGTTVLYADELSEEGIQRALEQGHAFVKLWASDDPDLRLEAVTENGARAMMGDPLAADRAKFTARVLGGREDGRRRQLLVMRDGREIARTEVQSDDFTYEFDGNGAGDYRLQLQRGTTIDALTNPITLGARPLAMKARLLRPRRPRARKTRRYVFEVRLRAQDRETPLAGAVVRFAGRKKRTNERGIATISKRIRRPGRRRAVVAKPGLDRKRVIVKVKRRRR